MLLFKLALVALGLLAASLALAGGVLDAGAHGAVVVGASLVPVILGGLSLATRRSMPRWASAVCLVALMIVGTKTSEAFENVMMAAAGGMLSAVALLIRPDRPGLKNPPVLGRPLA